MAQVEKAKAYDELIEKLRDFYRDYDTISHLIDVKEELANLIPELRESEDERIRKMLIEFFGKGAEYNSSTNGISDKDILAWLEKQQGEQKPTDNDKIEALRTEYEKGRADAIAEMQVAWSEEDEKMIENIIDTIRMSIEDCDVDDIGTKARFSLEKERDWLKNKLKSPRPQNHWKPSERELGAMLTAISDERQKGSDVAKELVKIFQQLKKLREE